MRTDFLFPRPSFWSGVSRLFDLFGRFDRYNVSPNERIADERALRADFYVVGQDLADAIRAFDAEVREGQLELFEPPTAPRGRAALGV